MPELLRRLVLLLFGGLLFEAPLLRHLKNAVYRRVFNMGPGCNTQYGVKFVRVHPTDHVPQTLAIGSRVAIGAGSFIDYSGGVTIGDDTWLSHHVTIYTHDHHVERRVLKKDQPITFHPLSIGRDCWLASNTTILPSVGTIGDGAIIGAGAVVTKPVAPYTIVAGNPARVIGERTG
jgi:acetyltransferase-like isoleucine patch superfamily enzyme